MKSFRRRPDRRGVTFFELMAVLVIVGVLAMIAVPTYNRYIRHARISEATARIGDIITGAKVWAQENAGGAAPNWPTAADAVNNPLFNLDNSDNFQYQITAGAGLAADNNAFEIQAQGLGGTDVAGVTVTMRIANINQTGDNAPVIQYPGGDR